MVQNGRNGPSWSYFKRVLNSPKWPKGSQMVPQSPKWSNTVHNGLNVSKSYKMAETNKKCCNMFQHFFFLSPNGSCTTRSASVVLCEFCNLQENIMASSVCLLATQPFSNYLNIIDP